MNITCVRPNCTRTVYRGNRNTGLCRTHYESSAEYNPRGPAVEIPADHIVMLLNRGYKIRALSLAAGLSQTHLSTALNHGLVSAETHRKIMDLDPEDAPTQPAYRATRRLRALMGAGWLQREIQEATGLPRPWLRNISCGTVSDTNNAYFQILKRFYEEHEADPLRPKSRYAGQVRWAPPLAWDDIDDPSEDADDVPPVSAEISKHHVRQLREVGMTWEQVASTLGLPDAKEVDRLLKRSKISRRRRDSIQWHWLKYQARRDVQKARSKVA